MNILVTGRGTGGSWAMRGEQLGRAIGATVQRDARDVAAFDVAVLVKRPAPGLVERIHAAGVPLVWDIVDAYPQPQSDSWRLSEAMAWLCQQVDAIRPTAIVAATHAMQADCAGFGVPVRVVRHHPRSGIERNPLRERVERVGYEGGTGQLGAWADTVSAACRRRGWQFVINPARLADVDIVVALRQAGGYPARRWKSNVKLANAQASGTPVICCREAGYLETATGGERWADTAAELDAALEELLPLSARQQAVRYMTAPPLESIAAGYRKWLMELALTEPQSSDGRMAIAAG